MQIVYNIDGIMESFYNHEPGVYNSNTGVYRYSYMYMNIFNKKFYAGRIMIGEIYNKFRDIDYSLIKYLALLFTEKVIESNSVVEINSDEFRNMLDEMLKKNKEYKKEYDYILARKKWQKNDNYMVTIFEALDKVRGNTQLLTHAAYIQNNFSECYTLVYSQDENEYKNSIVIISNITKGYKNKKETTKKIKIFMNIYKYNSGCSSVINDFSDIYMAFTQARQAIIYAKNKDCEINDFDENAMKIIMENCLEKYSDTFFMSTGIKKLIDYDKKHDTELILTLRTYIFCNMNIKKALDKLHIHRSTFTYRLTKIENILDRSIQNSDYRLYVMFCLKIMEIYIEKNE